MRKVTILFTVQCLALTVWVSLPQNYQLPQDWLLNSKSFKSKITTDKVNNRLTLTNGLVSRTFSIEPNGATVDFRNLMTGESLLRAVEPEAVVWINGQRYEVGGLQGQSNHAFLREDWINNLSGDPLSFQLKSYKKTGIKKRFEWNRTRHHDQSLAWPARGTAVQFTYELDAETELKESDFRQVTFSNNIENGFVDAWTISKTDKHPRANFNNEGKSGEIYTPANSSVLAEKQFKKFCNYLAVTLNTGTDKSTTYAPAVAVKVKNKFMKFNLQTANNHFALEFDGKVQKKKNSFVKAGMDFTFITKIDKETVSFYAAQGQNESLIFSVKLAGARSFQQVKIGKMGIEGKFEDGSEVGEIGRCRFISVIGKGNVDRRALNSFKNKRKDAKGVTVDIFYEIYDGIPVIGKRVEVKNSSGKDINVDRFILEQLAFVEYESSVETRKDRVFNTPNVAVETDYSMGGFSPNNSMRKSYRWKHDPRYNTQVHWPRCELCMLEVAPEFGPDQTVKNNATFETYNSWLVVYDSYDRERKGLTYKKMMRTLAPWVTENPIMYHCTSSNPKFVKEKIDECAATGFELLIMSFGSGFNYESDDPAYIAKWKEVVDYGKSKGVEVGGYSLLASRRISPAEDNCHYENGKVGASPFGNCPNLVAPWAQNYFKKLQNFMKTAGLCALENDGSYPGAQCSKNRPGTAQKGWNSSRWAQFQEIKKHYRKCRELGVFLNAPDWYFMNGANKTGMGYREVNWSLPRAEQLLHTRQNIYDGTWIKAPSMGWMFIPLTVYHGGGKAATVEPLNENLMHYEGMLASNLLLGTQFSCRGPRLYDTENTKRTVKKWTDLYKKHRAILESDLLHLRRADGKDIDYMLHVNPNLKEKAFLAVFNPLKRAVKKTISVPLYYAGLYDETTVTDMNGKSKVYKLNRSQKMQLNINIPAGGIQYFIFTN